MNIPQWWFERPSLSLKWMIIPLGYTLFLQGLTGIPQPQSLREINASEALLLISEELFSYPFWLQDLSHLPLFLIFAWLWSWYFGRFRTSHGLFKNQSLLISLSYAFVNEGSQFFVPMRFPSLGDLVMNLAGVSCGLFLHSYFCNKKDSMPWAGSLIHIIRVRRRHCLHRIFPLQ